MVNTEDLGVSYIHNQIAKMGFFFREQPKHDFGIDAHIEIADDSGKGTGKNIAVQIKSGSSYNRSNQHNEIVHYTDERHIRYWSEHSLSVILVIYDPEEEVARWSNVKAYISRHPSMLSQGPYKIAIPDNQIFDISSKDELVALATDPQVPLSSDRKHFSIISLDDISTAQAKRYRAEILVGNANNDVARMAIYQATEHLKYVVEHSSNRQATYWRDQQPHMIILFVYRDLDDKAHTNWIARSIWRDPNNEGAKLVKFGKMNDYTEDIEIDFADKQKQEIWRQFISNRVITKHEFLKKVERWITISDDLVGQAVTLTQKRDNNYITQDTYVNDMSALAQMYTEQVEHKYDDGTIGPSEARDAEIKYVGTIHSGGNVFIAFTPHGLETWTDPRRRKYMVKSYLKRYEQDREMLRFELRKLTG